MTDMKLLKAELTEIIDESNDNIVVTDGEGVVLRVSKNCIDIYGLRKEELIGKTVFQLEKENVFYPSVSAQVLKEKKRIQVMQTTLTGKHVMATGIPMFDEDHKITRVISFSHDLTELKQIKEEYEHLQQKMAQYELKLTRYTNVESEGLIMKSEAMKKVWQLSNRAAKSDASVLLLGESGVGKSAIARVIHRKSYRKNEELIEVNCGAIPHTLFESEFFGYEKGAFTGAKREGKVGLIELAHKGTLFLDEVAELPVDLQVKLLKVIEEKKFTRIGGTKAIEVDFRLVAATNQNLKQKVIEGEFRKDLYYRLNVIPIEIPPLRQRKEDIYELANYYLAHFNKKYEVDKAFHSKTLDTFLNYDWPGNVREFENLIERLVVTTESDLLVYTHIPSIYGEEPNEQLLDWSFQSYEEKGLTLQEALEEIEKAWLIEAFQQAKTTYEMANYLGLSQSTVVRRLRKYGIKSK